MKLFKFIHKTSAGDLIPVSINCDQIKCIWSYPKGDYLELLDGKQLLIDSKSKKQSEDELEAMK